MIKTILFDYAGVITPTRDNYKFAQLNHERFGLEPLELMHKTYKNWDKALIGEISDKQFWEEIAEDLKINPDELKNLIIETFPIENRLVELIDQIKNKYTIVMVSNQVEDWLEKAIDDNDLRDKFHFFVNSYHVKAKKPDEKIFLAALEVSGSKPKETLFIDDVVENIKAAKSLGIQGIQFDTFEQFLEEFNQKVQLD